MVEELSTFFPSDLADLAGLIRELSETSNCDERSLADALNDKNVHVFVIRDGDRIGLIGENGAGK
ncbi:MAG: hypothetical protein J6X55_04810, partial [Victivallales bacterium]|nr:hypothetical protein [Victivallales bacterium]